MTIVPGTVLDHYEVRGLLGAGGMGEVYRAWDARLRREVAVKILGLGPASDGRRLQRFEQEARAAGALNHPNITAVYDTGAHDGIPYIVSERLEGETLRSRLDSGSLTPAKAVEFAIQIARGLSAAHERGIVHRDLKPENVFVCGDGVVKILDFGIAKLRDHDTLGERWETVTLDTRASTGAGTVAYMSPEQIRGVAVDARSDIFSLGVVLYEMLAARRPFSGDALSELHTSILRDDPEPLPRRLAGVERVIRRCLEKRPEDRFDTARDVAHALDAALPSNGHVSIAGSAWRLPSMSKALPVALALAGGLALGAVGIGLTRAPASQPAYTQLTFQRGSILGARFAPDGQTIVYSAAWGGAPPRLFTTRIGSTESRDLGFEGDVWSVSASGDLALRLPARPAVAASGILARLALAGGAPRELLDDVAAASWDAGGGELAVLRATDDRSVIESPPGTVAYRSPGTILTMCTLPGRRLAVFERLPNGGDRPCVLTLVNADGSRQILSSGWTDWIGAPVVWSQKTGEILFASFAEAEAALSAATPAGRTRVVARVPGDFQLRDVDARGRMLLVRNVPRGGVVLSKDDEGEQDASWLDFSYVADVSGDGEYLLLGDISAGLPGGGIAIRKTDGAHPVELGRGVPLALSADKSRVLAMKSADGSDHLLVIPTGAGQRRELRHAALPQFFGAAWFPDNTRIVTIAGPDAKRARLYVWDVDGRLAPRAVSDEGAYRCAVVSPDGRRIAVWQRAHPLAVYAADGASPRTIPRATADDEPLRWTADGKSLFVRVGSGMPAVIERVNVETGERSSWHELMPSDRAGLLGISGVTITPDGATYAYTFASAIGTLYMAEGLR